MPPLTEGFEPRASVVVATWNWSSALRLALASALAQTVREIEILVIGDGCTDDSAEVVASLGDSRLVWRNRQQNSGNQAAPNDDGLALARAPWVAYLGHDDLWHPRHLEDLLATAERRGADLVHSIALSYGPPESGVVAASGVEPTGGHRAPPDLRPSSVAHRRDLALEAGGWGDPRTTDRPADDAFFARLWASGARFAGSNRVTTFKFPAGWRRDAYRLRDVTQQAALWARLRDQPDQVERELCRLLVAFADGTGSVALEPEPPGPEGWREARRRFKGLSAGGAETPAPARVDLGGPLPGLEWHPAESDAEGAFRWSAAREAALEVPWGTAPGEPARLRLGLAYLLDAADLGRLEVAVDAFSVALVRTVDAAGNVVLAAELPAVGDHRRRLARVVVRAPALRRPCDLDPANSDRRRLGVALRWAEIVPGDEPGEKGGRR
jgi:hypothetical protein